ncbi:MAG: DUF6722 family protein [bacterium]
MALIKTEKQKDNFAKFSYDLAKIILAVMVIGPLAKPESFNIFLFVGGFLVAALFFLLGFLLDSKELKIKT